MQTMIPQTTPPKPWIDLAAAMLASFKDPRRHSWFFRERTPKAGRFELDGDDDFGDVLPDLDELLDQAENPEDVLETHCPRPGPLLALLRLARTFESFENFWSTITAPGAILLLSTGHPEHDAPVAELLEKLIRATGDWPPGRRPRVYKTDGAVRAASSGARGETGSVEGFSKEFQEYLEAGVPLILIGASPAALPKPLIPLAPRDIRVAPLDQDILCEFLGVTYPKDAQVDPDALRENLSSARPEFLTLTDLMIATRAGSALEACAHLAVRTQPTAQRADHPRLQDFPLPGPVREALAQMLEDMRLWRAGQLSWDDVMRGMLVHGPTGSGKTEIARLLAREAGISVHAGSLSKWMSSGSRGGDTTREMRKFFDTAAGDAPCIIFVDELDALGDRARPHDHNSSWTDGVVAAFLECVDGFEQTDGVILVGATNHVEKLDAAILRPGRFDKLIRLEYPTRDWLPEVFRWHLKSDLRDADLSILCNRAVGMSGAMVGALVREARARARRARRPLSLDDLDAVVSEKRPERPEAHRRLVAVHEAGHALVAAATGAYQPMSIAILPDGGAVEQRQIQNVMHREQIEAEIMSLLAGRAAEQLVFGQVSGGAGGHPSSDLARATEKAAALELSYGLGASGAVWLGAPGEVIGQLRGDLAMRGIIRNRLAKLETSALNILKKNRDVLDDLAAELLREGYIHGAALDQHLARIRRKTEPEAETECAENLTTGTAC